MRKALVVGLDYYARVGCLFGCVNDAHGVKAALERHSDGSINFDVLLLTATSASDAIDRAELKEGIRELFTGDSDIALLYFAGHGYIEETGGYLLSSETTRGDDGIPLSEIITLANKSPAKNRIIILDSCHSGVAGASAADVATAELAEGLTILTASTAEQYASEEAGAGVFTTLLVDALSGAAANLVGDITPGSIYAHIDQSLGPWDQRPVFKTNVKSFVSVRRATPPISLSELRRLATLFPTPGHEINLDPSFEPTSDSPDSDNVETFSLLQKYNRVNLVVPVGEEHMYYAAMNSKPCKLTVLGEHYRRLIVKGRI